MFTNNHKHKYLEAIIADEHIFTSDEHSTLTEKEHGDTIYTSKASLLRHYLPQDYFKADALCYIKDRIIKHKYNSVVSLGSGPCVVEYLLSLIVPAQVRIIASDFDEYSIKKAEEFFKNIIPLKFDLFEDDFSTIPNILGSTPDIVVMFGSSYVMDDKQFIELFSSLRKNGVKEVVDMYSGFITWRMYLKYLLIPGLPIFTNWHKKGKFHGFARSKRELRRLYRESGFKIIEENKFSFVNYAAVISPIT